MTFAPELICELPRYKRLQKLRRYYKSTQYEGRPDFFTGLRSNGGEPVPLRERAPCIVYPLPRGLCQQVTRFTFGEARFPEIKAESEEDSASQLSEEQADDLAKFIARLVNFCHLKSIARRVMQTSLAIGTNVAILSVVDGVFFVDVANAEDCWPEFDGDNPRKRLKRVTWCYQYDRTVPGLDGRPVVKKFWFRKEIDENAITDYAPEEVVPGKKPVWKVTEQSVHGWGFCPVLWLRNLVDEDTRDIDGASLFGELLDEFDALNFALSQRHRGIHNFGTPQPFETGVEDDDGPQAEGRVAVPMEYSPASGPSPHGEQMPSARPSGPDRVWSYRNPQVAVGIIETTGKSFEVATAHVNDVRSRILEATSIVMVNVADVFGRASQGEMSAKFLELAYEPLIALVDEMRPIYWATLIQPLLAMMLRVVALTGGIGLMIPGAAKAAAILRGTSSGDQSSALWMPPTLTPHWGPYFSAGDDEIGQKVQNAALAKDGGLVPKKDAAASVLPYFGRRDVQQAIDEIEDEEQEALAMMHELEKNAGQGARKPPAGGTAGNPAPAGGNRGGSSPASPKKGEET